MRSYGEVVFVKNTARFTGGRSKAALSGVGGCI